MPALPASNSYHNLHDNVARRPKTPLIKNVPAVILTGITYLNLRDCNMGFIGQDLIDAMMFLTRADLHGNQLTTLPRFPKTLEHLVVGNNELRALPNHICTLPALHTLDLSRNLLAVLPPGGFTSLTQLKHLFLAGNLLTEIPSLPSQKLKACSITYNCIPGLPAEFKQTNLTRAATDTDYTNTKKFLSIYYPNWSIDHPGST